MEVEVEINNIIGISADRKYFIKELEQDGIKTYLKIGLSDGFLINVEGLKECGIDLPIINKIYRINKKTGEETLVEEFQEWEGEPK